MNLEHSIVQVLFVNKTELPQKYRPHNFFPMRKDIAAVYGKVSYYYKIRQFILKMSIEQ